MPIVLGPGEIDHYKRVRPQVSFPAAHKFLTELRDLHGHTQNNVFLHDLTDSLKFNWKVWVSQRPDAADIVGLGINRFAFVWLSSMDSNTKERRGDFLVQRVDGIDICLHPQQKPNRETGLKEADNAGRGGATPSRVFAGVSGSWDTCRGYMGYM